MYIFVFISNLFWQCKCLFPMSMKSIIIELNWIKRIVEMGWRAERKNQIMNPVTLSWHYLRPLIESWLNVSLCRWDIEEQGKAVFVHFKPCYWCIFSSCGCHQWTMCQTEKEMLCSGCVWEIERATLFSKEANLIDFALNWGWMQYFYTI